MRVKQIKINLCLILLLVHGAIFSFGQNIEKIHALTGTKWGCFINDSCTSTYIFSHNNRFTYIDCELSADTITGTYYFENDSLIVEELHSSDEESYVPSYIKSKFIIVFKESKMYHVYRYDLIDNKYVKTDWVFPTDYVFDRIK